MARVLVTGGAGYVGSVCCSQLLARGHEVVVVDNLSTGHANSLSPDVLLHRVDIGNRKDMSKIFSTSRFDLIFHFAAKALVPESVQNPGVFFDTNVASSIALIEEARLAGIQKFVFSSSAAVYGNPVSSPIDEDHPKDPVNSYGETKLMLERVLQWYAKAYGWTVVAFRYFNACGATATLGEDHRPETHIIPLLLQTATAERDHFDIFGNDYPTPDGTCLRDYVHVLDIAEAHLLALQLPQNAGMNCYNIGTGTSYSVREVCDVVEQIVGTKLRLEERKRRQGDPAILCASPKRLMTDFKWKPQFSDLRGIIRSAWEWKKKYSSGYGGTHRELVTESCP